MWGGSIIIGSILVMFLMDWYQQASYFSRIVRRCRGWKPEQTSADDDRIRAIRSLYMETFIFLATHESRLWFRILRNKSDFLLLWSSTHLRISISRSIIMQSATQRDIRLQCAGGVDCLVDSIHMNEMIRALQNVPTQEIEAAAARIRDFFKRSEVATELMAAEAPEGRGTEPEMAMAPAGRGTEPIGTGEIQPAMSEQQMIRERQQA